MFCQNCGKEVADGSTFCPACGKATTATAQATPAPSTPAAPVGKKLHCPNCKSSNIQISTESSITSAVTSNGGAFSSTHFSNTHQNFWFCSDCGTKFRNIQNLEDEIKRKKNYPTIFAIFTAICLIAAIVLFIQGASSYFLGYIFYVYAIGVSIPGIICLLQIFAWKKKLNAMRTELAYLKVNCFN